MTSLSILVCDDLARRGAEAVNAIKRAVGSRASVERSFEGEFAARVTQFYKDTVNPAMNGHLPEGSVFDDYDIIVLDSNLSELNLSGIRLTAAGILGHIRAFSSSKYIVTINRFPYRDFDLSGLSPMGDTMADLSVNTKHLSSTWLWFRERGSERDFCPWYWPTLSDAPQRRSRQLRDLGRLDDRVLEFFSFPDVGITGLSNEACAALEPTSRNSNRVTFRDFFRTACGSLAPGEKELLLKSENSVAIKHIIAAEMEAWLYRHVLAPQTVLVDVPHLLPRVPILLGRNASAIEAWNRAIANFRSPYGLSGAYYRRYLRKWLFSRAHWFAVPAFWWGPIRSDRDLDRKLMAVDNEGLPNFLFCEDVSRFQISEIGEWKSFDADFRSTFSRRYVRRLRGVKYIPVDNFLK